METLDLRPPPTSPRRGGLVAAGVVLLVAAIVVGIGWQQRSGRLTDQADDEPSPTPTAVTTRRLPTTAPSPAPVRPRTWRTAPFLVEEDLDLFAVGDGQLYRIETRRRQVTATLTDTLNSSPVSMVVGRRSVLVRDWNRPAGGFVVPDGQPAQDLPEVLASASQVLAGPPDRLWVMTDEGDRSVTRLTDFAGRPVPAAAGPAEYRGLRGLVEDQDGGLLLSGIGGVYELAADGPQRLARGSVVAVGPRHLLVSDCDARLRCSRYLVSRATGERRRVAATSADDYGEGSVSTDGRYAAVWNYSGQGLPTLTVLDLQTNATLARVPDNQASPTMQVLVWLPGNRLLGVRDGRLFLFDPATRRTTEPDLGLGRITQISVRPAAR